jgi:hypothetical protein
MKSIWFVVIGIIIGLLFAILLSKTILPASRPVPITDIERCNSSLLICKSTMTNSMDYSMYYPRCVLKCSSDTNRSSCLSECESTCDVVCNSGAIHSDKLSCINNCMGIK